MIYLNIIEITTLNKYTLKKVSNTNFTRIHDKEGLEKEFCKVEKKD